jgi:Tol biopolymer transport system component/DNA-binding winged helix-turn-helix (wHTH) protein
MCETARYTRKILLTARFRVHGCLVDSSVNRVTRGDDTVQVEPKIMQVLVQLAEQAGDVVTRDAIMARVWSGVFVTDDALNRAIRELRRLFGDDPDAPQVIETIRKRGYRLIAQVEPVNGGASASPARAVDTPQKPVALDWVPGAASMAAMLMAAVLAGAAIAWFGLARPSVRAEPRVRFVPLTTSPGNEVTPALSPSGRLAYVARGDDGRAHLFAKRPPHLLAAQVTRGPGRELAPTWSPDDHHLAFARVLADACDIWIVDVDAGGERRIAPCGTRDTLQMSWSPNGATLAITAGDHRLTAPSHIALLTIASGTTRAVTVPPAGHVGDDSPAFSPDGRRLAFVRSISGSIGDIFVTTLDRGEPHRVTVDNADVLGIDWDRDGEHIIFSSERAGGISVWRVAASGGEPTLVAGGGAKLKHPSVARRDGAIAYEDWHYEINLIERPTAPAAGATARGVPISPTSDQWNFHPQISPDAARIAFQSTRSGQYELWVADRDGGHAVQVTRSGTYKSLPRWSPDGRRLVYSARTREGADLIVLDVDSRDSRTITSDAISIVAPSFSHDGRHVYFGSRRGGDWQVWRVEADGGGASESITTSGGYAAMESPDGASLYYTRLDRRGLWRRPVGGGTENLVADAIEAEDWANVAVTDGGVYFVTRPDDGDPQLAVVDERTNRMRLLTRLPEFAWSGVAVSRDGARVLYAHADRREANIVGMQRIDGRPDQ